MRFLADARDRRGSRRSVYRRSKCFPDAKDGYGQIIHARKPDLRSNEVQARKQERLSKRQHQYNVRT
jgi:hypothetical protein